MADHDDDAGEITNKQLLKAIKTLDRKIDTQFGILDHKIDTKFDSLDQKIDDNHKETIEHFRKLKKQVEVNESILEAIGENVAGLYQNNLLTRMDRVESHLGLPPVPKLVK